MDYQAYEIACEKIREENKQYLGLFQAELKAASLSDKTIQRHLSNVDLFINDFLLYEEPVPMKDGCGHVELFLGDFYIRKCMWSTPGNIKTTAASLKKFYKCMADHGKVKKEEYNWLCETIKNELEQWQADCARFNDLDEDDPFGLF